MSKSSGGGNTQTQTTTSTVRLPGWVNDAARRNLAAAYQVSSNMMGPYSGQRVADMAPGQMQNIQALQSNIGATNPAFAYAQGLAANVGNYQPAQVNAGYLANTDLNPYMNPFTQSVISSGLNALDQQRLQSLNQVGDQALRTGAFGGSRQGITEAVTNAAAAQQAGSLASNLMAQNFAQAQAAAQGDLQRNLAAQQLNQAAGLSGAGLNLNAASTLGSLAAQGQQSFLQGIGAASAAQDQIQRQNQAILDAQRQYYGEQQQFPIQQLMLPLQALGMTPYGSTTTQVGTVTQPSQSGSPLLGGLGGALAAYGAGLGPWGALAGGAIGALGSSDRDMKTDIKKVGKDPETGLPLYAYRYKGDPKSYPKVVGPMAQDIEKKYPDQVVDVGGSKAVNLGFGPMKRAFA